MLRELLHIGPVTIYGYGLMVAIGVISCVLVGMNRAKKLGVNPDILFNAAFIGIIFGIIGAKLMYWITIFPDIIKNPKLLLDLTGGFVVYGGLVLGVGAAIVYLRIKKEPALSYIDIAAASIALGQGFGRIGCFLAGCCYGKVAPDGAWYAVTFPTGGEAPAGIGLYPTQLMSSAFNFLLFFFLCYMTTRVRFRGAIVSLYMMIYSAARFLIEFIRTEPQTVGPLTTAQFTAIFVFTAGLILFIIMKKKALPPLRFVEAGEKPLESPEEEKASEPEPAEEVSEEPEETEEEPDTSEEALEELSETAEELTEETADTAEEVSEAIAETEEAAEELTETVEEAAEEVASDIEETAEEIAADIEETAEAAEESIAEPEDNQAEE